MVRAVTLLREKLIRIAAGDVYQITTYWLLYYQLQNLWYYTYHVDSTLVLML